MKNLSLGTLLVPHEHKKIIDQAKQYRRSQYQQIFNFSKALLDQYTKSAKQSIEKLAAQTDPVQLTKLCYIIFTVYKLTPDDIEDYNRILTKIQSEKHEQLAIFIYYIKSKLCKIADSEFSRQRIDLCKKKIKDTPDPIILLYFLKFLAKSAPKVVLQNSELFTECIKNVKFVKVDGTAILKEAVDLFLTSLSYNPDKSQEDLIQTLFDIASDSDVKTSLSIYASLLSNKNVHQYLVPQIDHMLGIFSQLLVVKVANIHELALLCSCLSAQINKEKFLAMFGTRIVTILNEDNKIATATKTSARAYIIFATIFPEMVFQSASVFQVFRALLWHVFPEGFELLDLLAQRVPSMLRKNLNVVFSSLSSASLTEDYVKYLPKIFEKRTLIWEGYRETFVQRMLKQKCDIMCIKALGRCPPIQSEELRSLLKQSLSSESEEIRAIAPKAFLRHAEGLEAKTLAIIVEEVLAQCLCEMSAKVRLATIKALPVTMHRFLCSSKSLEYLGIIANDEDIEVKVSTVELLCELNKISPLGVLPILRRVILDDMYLLNTPRNHRLRAETSRVILAMSGVSELLPMYVSIILKIFLQHFACPPSSDLTYFERNSHNTISINLALTVNNIAKKNIELLMPQMDELVSAALRVLTDYNMKELKIAVVTMLTNMLANCTPEFILDRGALFKKVITLATKWNLLSLNQAFLKLLGIIGAVEIDSTSTLHELSSEVVEEEEIDSNHTAFYLKTVCRALLDVIEEESLAQNHIEASRILVLIFCTKEQSLRPIFNRFVPQFIGMIRRTMNKELIDSLKRLCLQAPSLWLIKFSEEIIGLIYNLWNTEVLEQLLTIIPALAYVLLDRFGPFLPQSISLLLDCLFSHRTTNECIAEKAINSLLALKKLSEVYLFLIIPEIVSIITYPMTLGKVRRDAFNALRIYVQSLPVTQYVSEISRCCIYAFSSGDSVLIETALQTLYSLQVILGSSLDPNKEQLLAAMNENRISAHYYLTIEEYRKRGSVFLSQFRFINKDDPSRKITVPDVIPITVPVNMAAYLEKAKYKGQELKWRRKGWFKQFMIDTIKSSPAFCISLVSPIAVSLEQVGEQIFNAAFLSCWEVMSEGDREVMVNILTEAITSPKISKSSLSVIIGLIEFMDRVEVPMEIKNKTLCEICLQNDHYAKAYLFATKWYEQDRSVEAQDTMIYLASMLKQKENVVGLVKRFGQGEIHPKWHEQLGDWNSALEGYKKLKDVEGQIRCMGRLMQWQSVINTIEGRGGIAENPRLVHDMVTALHFTNCDSKLMQMRKQIDKNDAQSHIYVASACLKCGEKEEALKYVKRGFEIIARQTRTMFKHDKSRLYSTLVQAQNLTEISEKIHDKANADVWVDRLRLAKQSFEVVSQIIDIRYPFMSEEEKTSNNAFLLKSALKSRAWSAFDSILKNERQHSIENTYIFAQSMWERGHPDEAMAILREMNFESETPHLASRIFQTIGLYILRSKPPDEVDSVLEEAIPYFEKSIKLDPTYYRAWHRFGWASSSLYRTDESKKEIAINAVEGFIKCVELEPKYSFSDLIQMVYIAFKTDLGEDLFIRVKKAIKQLAPNTLLSIIPQIYAQLESENPKSNRFAVDIINALLPQNFHSLLYPLFHILRDMKGTQSEREAREILGNFSKVNGNAVKQVEIIVNGLYAASNIALERWLDLIIAILHYLPTSANPHANFPIAKSLFENAYQELLNPKCPDDERFAALYRPDKLDKVHQFFTSDVTYGNAERRIQMVHNILRKHYEESSEHMKSIRALKLPDIAPELGSMRDFIVAIPGTYQSETEVVTIRSFDSTMEVIGSKQHPRIVVMHGSDGKAHRSLLKGREDLRLDQRVMQFFGLINMHMHNALGSRRSLSIHTYAITPLSNQSGLIQFIDDTDTLYSLIHSYRRSRGRNTDIETKFADEQFIADVDLLTRIQRMEYIIEADRAIKDTDLAAAIWAKSPGANEWIYRTTRFAMTSGLMSIIGYILGLGDRHPSNLMMHRRSGDVIHIDFSDCFEVGRFRTSFPEAVPFRLTRMMKEAFGPSNIEGNFRITCEETMVIVRTHRESIMTVLDIFLQVPLNPSVGMYPVGETEESRPDIHTCLDRITDKIIGKDFDDGLERCVSEQVDGLIQNATEEWNLASMYHGWTPLW